ncbi:hypothetical protein [Selenomonas ruminantium]|uniref:Uncharacterized protein n=1 Tax=Selenomonas ruminantium TaxID=971 RepID=A0A1I0YCQ6_SELRU|nr:hypothetical protein [Selenomonas ruminantium]SFB10556.1 hypothetical protein SAMN05216587_11177 [Selenomonas ruminantium]
MVKKMDLVKLAKKFNMSHRYKRRNEEVAPHHHREQMKCVAAKAKAEMVAHRNSRRAKSDK